MIGVYQQEGLNLFNCVEMVIKKYLRQDSLNIGFFRLPPDSYNPLRQQYDAMTILKYIAENNRANFNFTIGLVDIDIYSHGMNFIFGLADPLKKTALVSIYRLTGDKMMARISKEVVHELGHLLGLGHCSNLKCVMYFSNTVNDTDNKNIDLCKECRSDIE